MSLVLLCDQSTGPPSSSFHTPSLPQSFHSAAQMDTALSAVYGSYDNTASAPVPGPAPSTVSRSASDRSTDTTKTDRTFILQGECTERHGGALRDRRSGARCGSGNEGGSGAPEDGEGAGESGSGGTAAAGTVAIASLSALAATALTAPTLPLILSVLGALGTGFAAVGDSMRQERGPNSEGQKED